MENKRHWVDLKYYAHILVGFVRKPHTCDAQDYQIDKGRWPNLQGNQPEEIAGGVGSTFRYILWVMHQSSFYVYKQFVWWKQETSSRDNTKM